MEAKHKIKLFRNTCNECGYTYPIFSKLINLNWEYCTSCESHTIKVKHIPIIPAPKPDWIKTVKVYIGGKS